MNLRSQPTTTAALYIDKDIRDASQLQSQHIGLRILQLKQQVIALFPDHIRKAKVRDVLNGTVTFNDGPSKTATTGPLKVYKKQSQESSNIARKNDYSNVNAEGETKKIKDIDRQHLVAKLCGFLHQVEQLSSKVVHSHNHIES